MYLVCRFLGLFVNPSRKFKLRPFNLILFLFLTKYLLFLLVSAIRTITVGLRVVRYTLTFLFLFKYHVDFSFSPLLYLSLVRVLVLKLTVSVAISSFSIGQCNELIFRSKVLGCLDMRNMVWI